MSEHTPESPRRRSERQSRRAARNDATRERAAGDDGPQADSRSGARDGDDDLEEAPGTAEEVSPAGRTGLRYLFYLLWLVLLPVGLALAAVWLLTPSPAEASADWFRSFVGEQQVPALILFFTIFAMLLWRFRYALPLAGGAGVLPRGDLPARLRARFDEAAHLLDEAHRIMRSHERQVVRALGRTEREELRDALDALDETMRRTPLDEEAFTAKLGRAGELVTDRLGRWRKGELREYGESIGVAVAVALVLRIFVVEAFKIPSGSMLPTLAIGDHIFVAKYAYGPLLPYSDSRLYTRMPPAHGDVVVFKFPENTEQDFIKRVVALPGDRLEALDGRLVLNGWLAPHCYVGRLELGPGLTGELYVEYLEGQAYFTMLEQKSSEDGCSTDVDCGVGRACRGQVCGSLQGPYYVAQEEVWVMGDNRNNSHDSRSWRSGMGAGVPFRNIKGRAMFVWMSWNASGGVSYDRLFVNVMGQPKLPAGSPAGLQRGLDACLARPPSRAESTPPGSR